MIREISTILTLIINILLIIYCIKRFKRHPLSFDVIIYFMYLIFYYIPLLDYIYSWGMFSNNLLRVNGYVGDIETAIKFNFVSLFIISTFMMGFRIKFVFFRKRQNSKKQTINNVRIILKKKKLYYIKIILFITLALVVFSALRNYNYGIRNFFSMARKEAYTSNIQTTLVTVIPTILLSLEFIEEVITYKRIRPKLFLYALLSIFVTMTRGQRRELINEVIFIALLLIYGRSHKYYSLDRNEVNSKIRRYIILLGALVAVLIPATWYLRVYSTQFQYGYKINPFQYRGWLELLFGSSSTGFQTSIILDNYNRDYGLPSLASVKLMLSYFIPRAFFNSKAMVLTRYVQQGLGTSGNLSVFYINDVWFNFYYFSPLISLLLGKTISNIVKNLDDDYNLFRTITKYVAFSKVITLFKNGYTGYFFSFIIFWVIWRIIERLVCIKKTEK